MVSNASVKPVVVVVGAEYLHSQVSYSSREYDNVIVRKEPMSSLRDHELQEWEIVVLPYTLYLSMRTRAGYSPDHYYVLDAPLVDVLNLEQQVFAALERGRTMCILSESIVEFPNAPDKLKIHDVYRIIGRDEKSLEDNVIGYRILESLGVNQTLEGSVTSCGQIKRSEFREYLCNFGAGCVNFRVGHLSADIICCHTEYQVTGFCLQHSKGNILVLPYVRHDRPDFDKAMEALASGIVTYLSKIAREEPEWTKGFTFAQEKSLLQRKQELDEETKDVDSQLARFSSLRAILWQRDYALQNSVPCFLNELGIETRQEEGFEADFWITRDAEDIIIAEVKSMNKNVTRQDIAKLDGHRKATGKSDDFPALLVANTFATLQAAEEKEKRRIGSNECERAADDHILVMRTIDLINIYELIAQGRLELSQFVDILLKESGWLKVTSEGWEIVKQ